MVGMDFGPFLVLLVISVVVAAVFHFSLSYRVIPGWGSYLSKVVIGWLGGWLGSPVFGHWWAGLKVGPIYLVPAILGCAAAIILVVDSFQTALRKG